MKAAIGIALAIFGVSPALAQRATQSETGSIIPVPAQARIADGGNISAANRGRLAMAEFARCTVGRNRAGVQKVLRLPFGETYQHALSGLAASDCLADGMMKFNVVLFRGSLFTELYRDRDFAQTHHQAWNVSFDKIAVSQDPLTHPDQEARQRMALMYFAQCVVGHDEANARAAILLPTASVAQEAALHALGPSFNACFPAGSSITFSKPIIEGVLAEVLYRGVEMPAMQTAGIK